MMLLWWVGCLAWCREMKGNLWRWQMRSMKDEEHVTCRNKCDHNLCENCWEMCWSRLLEYLNSTTQLQPCHSMDHPLQKLWNVKWLHAVSTEANKKLRLPPQISRNRQEPPKIVKNRQKPPETVRNRQKPPETTRNRQNVTNPCQMNWWW